MYVNDELEQLDGERVELQNNVNNFTSSEKIQINKFQLLEQEVKQKEEEIKMIKEKELGLNLSVLFKDQEIKHLKVQVSELSMLLTVNRKHEGEKQNISTEQAIEQDFKDLRQVLKQHQEKITNLDEEKQAKQQGQINQKLMEKCKRLQNENTYTFEQYEKLCKALKEDILHYKQKCDQYETKLFSQRELSHKLEEEINHLEDLNIALTKKYLEKNTL